MRKPYKVVFKDSQSVLEKFVSFSMIVALCVDKDTRLAEVSKLSTVPDSNFGMCMIPSRD